MLPSSHLKKKTLLHCDTYYNKLRFLMETQACVGGDRVSTTTQQMVQSFKDYVKPSTCPRNAEAPFWQLPPVSIGSLLCTRPFRYCPEIKTWEGNTSWWCLSLIQNPNKANTQQTFPATHSHLQYRVNGMSVALNHTRHSAASFSLR